MVWPLGHDIQHSIGRRESDGCNPIGTDGVLYCVTRRPSSMTGQPLRTLDPLAEEAAVDLEVAFPRLVEAYAGTVYTTARRFSHQAADADDLASETFAQAYKAMQSYPPERVRALDLRPWLVTIVLNLWRNQLRDTSRRPLTVPFESLHPASDAADGPEQLALAQSEIGDVAGLLAGLPEAQRIAIVLRHIVGLSYAEMATVLECPSGTAKSHVSRGLTALRSQLHSVKEALS